MNIRLHYKRWFVCLFVYFNVPVPLLGQDVQAHVALLQPTTQHFPRDFPLPV